MSDKQPMQSDGGGDTPRRPAVSAAPGKDAVRGESGGGAYPNPHVEETDKQSRTGGQTDMAYHGTGQLGAEKVPGEGNQNAPSRKP